MDDFLVLVAVRLKSSRLPRKAMSEIAGKPLLLRLLERLNENIPKSNIVVCTSSHQQDDELVEFAERYGYKAHQGSELDVAQRFIETAEKFKVTTVVRVTGDNPLTDSRVILSMLASHKSTNSEYTYTDDLPTGTRAEIIDVAALKRVRESWVDPGSSEYMTYMLMRKDKLLINKFNIDDSSLVRPQLRLTVDTDQDLEMMQTLYSYYKGSPPALADIIEFFDANPDIRLLEDLDNSATLPDHIDCSYLGDQ